MNITKHAINRYAERFKGISKQDIPLLLESDRERYSIELNKMIDNAIMIYTGKFNDSNGNTNFWVADDIILITDLKNTKIITLYRIDFGMGREINKVILQKLQEELNEAEEQYIIAMDSVKENKDKLLSQQLLAEKQIESLQEQLSAMKAGLDGIKGYIKAIEIDEVKAKTERDIVAKKIVYSNIYRNAVNEYCLDK